MPAEEKEERKETIHPFHRVNFAPNLSLSLSLSKAGLEHTHAHVFIYILVPPSNDE